MMPRLYAMPPFPYGQARVPPNRMPVFGEAPPALPALPELPALPAVPGGAPFPGKLQIGLMAGGVIVAAIGASLGNTLLVLAGVGSAAAGSLTYPWGALSHTLGWSHYPPFTRSFTGLG